MSIHAAPSVTREPQRRFQTRLTLGGRTEEFASSEDTLVTNVVATILIQRRAESRAMELCGRFRQAVMQALKTGEPLALHFEESDLTVIALEDQAPHRTSVRGSSPAGAWALD